MKIKENLRKGNGITLVALVVTIIVLLILAGVSISLVLGDNGIITKAKEAKERTLNAQIEEQEKLNEIVDYVENMGETTPETEDYSYLFDFDKTTGTILGINKDYIGRPENDESFPDLGDIYYYDITAYGVHYSYDDGQGWCVLKEPIDTLIVPSEIDGYKVNTIRNIGALNVRKVIVEEGITEITSAYNLNDFNTLYAKLNYSNVMLEEFIMPQSLTKIGDDAFFKCGTLKNITIPKKVNAMGESAFAHCTGLKSVIIEDGVTTIGSKAFFGCSGVTNLNIGNKVTTIGDHAFYSWSGLTNLTIPANVTTIETYAFSACDNLVNVYFEHTTDAPIFEQASFYFGVGTKKTTFWFKDQSVRSAFIAAKPYHDVHSIISEDYTW